MFTGFDLIDATVFLNIRKFLADLTSFCLASNYVEVLWKKKMISVSARDYVNLFAHAGKRTEKTKAVDNSCCC